jgi:hypothetical protein
VNAKYRGSQILPRVYPAQRGIRAGFISLPNWLSNCHAAMLSNFGESLPLPCLAFVIFALSLKYRPSLREINPGLQTSDDKALALEPFNNN